MALNENLVTIAMLYSALMRICSSWIAVWSISLVIGLAAPVYAGWGQAKLVGRHAALGTLAVDSTGQSHIIYGGGKKTSELVYTTYNIARGRGPTVSIPLRFLDQPSIAVDSLGVPHVAVVSNPLDDNPALIYLSLSGNQWQVQTIPDGSATGSPQLAIDAANTPHIAYYSAPSGLMHYAVLEDSQWQFENTGAAIYPTSMTIAKDGTIHVAGVTGSQVCEERGLNGVWNGECFDSYFGSEAFVGLAADGSPEVAYADDGPIKLATFDGTSWSVVPVIDASGQNLSAGNISFATDSNGRGSLFFLAGGPKPKEASIFYAHEQSNGSWQATDLGGSPFLNFFSLAMALDPAGLPHLVFSVVTSVVAFVGYGAETLPALAAQWESVTSAAKAGKTAVTGTLQVTNFGSAAAAGFTVDYYLSADDQLDPSATLIGHSALALAAGQAKTIKFNHVLSDTVSGEYLIADISTPNPQNEADTSTNVAASQIP